MEKEPKQQKCEAEIKRFSDTQLGPQGIATRTTCQRCEIFLIHKTANQLERSLRSADTSVNLVLQKCPKLIELGHKEGEIPQELLPTL